MASTVITKEAVDHLSDEEIDREIKLRIKAGAIRSWVEEVGGVMTLLTEWNILGEQ